jgi:hypothetical protein
MRWACSVSMGISFATGLPFFVMTGQNLCPVCAVRAWRPGRDA